MFPCFPKEQFAEMFPDREWADGISAAEVKKVQGDDAYSIGGPFFTGPDGRNMGVTMSAAAAAPCTLYNSSMDDAKLAACFMILNAFAQDIDMAITARFGMPGEDWKIEGSGNTSKAVGLNMGEASKIGASHMRNLYGPADVLNNEYFRLTSEGNPNTCQIYN